MLWRKKSERAYRYTVPAVSPRIGGAGGMVRKDGRGGAPYNKLRDSHRGCTA